MAVRAERRSQQHGVIARSLAQVRGERALCEPRPRPLPLAASLAADVAAEGSERASDRLVGAGALGVRLEVLPLRLRAAAARAVQQLEAATGVMRLEVRR